MKKLVLLFAVVFSVSLFSCGGAATTNEAATTEDTTAVEDTTAAVDTTAAADSAAVDSATVAK